LAIFCVRVTYRLTQFWQLITAEPLTAAAIEEITAVITPAEFDLYQRYSLTDQQHTYQVLSLLRQAGHTQPALLTAALLHDVGKTHGWKRPFVVKTQHPRWSADLARAAGSDPLAVWLMAQHQSPLPPPAERNERWQLLAQLQWADEQA